MMKHLENKKLEKEALMTCRELVADTDLCMSIIDAWYNFDRTQLIFRFVADERIFVRFKRKNIPTRCNQFL